MLKQDEAVTVDEASQPRFQPSRFQNVHQAIAWVQSEMRLERDRTAKIQGARANYEYSYVSEAAALNAVRRLLSPLGVAVYINAFEKRKDGNLTVATVTATFVHAQSGGSMTVSMDGYGTDPADKGYGKAVTSAVRYLMTKTFLQSGDLDPEDSFVEHEPQPRERSRRSIASEHLLSLVLGDVDAAKAVVLALVDKSSMATLTDVECQVVMDFCRWASDQPTENVTSLELAHRYRADYL